VRLAGQGVAAQRGARSTWRAHSRWTSLARWRCSAPPKFGEGLPRSGGSGGLRALAALEGDDGKIAHGSVSASAMRAVKPPPVRAREQRHHALPAAAYGWAAHPVRDLGAVPHLCRRRVHRRVITDASELRWDIRPLRAADERRHCGVGRPVVGWRGTPSGVSARIRVDERDLQIVVPAVSSVCSLGVWKWHCCSDVHGRLTGAPRTLLERTCRALPRWPVRSLSRGRGSTPSGWPLPLWSRERSTRCPGRQRHDPVSSHRTLLIGSVAEAGGRQLRDQREDERSRGSGEAFPAVGSALFASSLAQSPQGKHDRQARLRRRSVRRRRHRCRRARRLPRFRRLCLPVRLGPAL